MRHNEGYHRPRGAWQPNERQRAVLDLLVEGKSNAEIAAALAITVDGAKWYVGELLSQTGLSDRRELASWWAEERGRSRQAVFLPLWLRGPRVAVAGSVATVFLVIVTGWLLWSRGTESGAVEPPLAVAADVAPSPTPIPQRSVDSGLPPPCDTPLPEGYRIVTAEELRAEGLVEFGRIIQPRTCPLQVSNRADLAYFWMADGGEIDLAAAGLHIVRKFAPSGNSNYYMGSNCLPCDLGFYYEGEQFLASVVFQGDGQGAFARPNLAIEPNERRDHIVLRRTGANGATATVTLDGEVNGRRRVAFASDGTLFFDLAPLPGGLATNGTGEAIDLSRMTALGQLHFRTVGVPTGVWNSCSEETDVCRVGLPANSGALRLPVGGVLTCVPVMSAGIEREGYEIDTGDFILRLKPGGGYGSPWDGSCATEWEWKGTLTHVVVPGDEIYAWIYTSIEAFAPDGTPLSLVITKDGHLYIDNVTP